MRTRTVTCINRDKKLHQFSFCVVFLVNISVGFFEIKPDQERPKYQTVRVKGLSLTPVVFFIKAVMVISSDKY